MKRSYILLTLLCSITILAKEAGRGSDTLLKPDGAIELLQSDFNSGAKRITESGYYYLGENVVFEPDPVAEAERADKPVNGWFAALSIETDNVVLDMNAKTLESSYDFVQSQTFKVFSLIELNNSPFPHVVFSYLGETKLKSAKNVVIKNGMLGLSAHHGIHGNENVAVNIHDMVIRDWEVAGIALNALHSGRIKDVTISGIEHTIPFTGLLANAAMARINLEDLVNGGDTAAQLYLDDLNTFIAETDFASQALHDSNAYGLFINRISDVGPIPKKCTETATNCVLIENVTVCNIKSKIVETVIIQDNNGVGLRGHRFGGLRWRDAFSNGSTLSPNALIKAQVYTAKKAAEGSTDMPVGFPEDVYPSGFADNILSDTPSESLFVSHVRPQLRSDFPGHRTKGVFGIRVDCGYGVTIKNCRVMGILNEGELGESLAGLPGGSYFTEESRYTGNDVYGISLAACHNCKVIDSCVSDCYSKHGRVHGIAVMNESQANHIINTTSSDHYADFDNDGESIVNPPSEVYGFYMNSDANANEFNACTSQSLRAPRRAYGFYTRECRDIRFSDCLSVGHQVTSSDYPTVPKLVAGFAVEGGSCHLFKECESRGVRVNGEVLLTVATPSVAAGLYATSDSEDEPCRNLDVQNCRIACIHGGNGLAAGMWLEDSEYGSILGNWLSHTTADAQGLGYGVLSSAFNNTHLIIKNVAYNNKTSGYQVPLNGTRTLPVIRCFYDSLSGLSADRGWMNVEFTHR